MSPKQYPPIAPKFCEFIYRGGGGVLIGKREELILDKVCKVHVYDRPFMGSGGEMGRCSSCNKMSTMTWLAGWGWGFEMRLIFFSCPSSSIPTLVTD